MFFKRNAVPDGRGNTDKQKRRYLGFRGSVGKGWRAGGSEPLSSLLGAGESLFRWKTQLPLGGVPPRRRFRYPRCPNHHPSQFLRTPQRGGTAVPLRLLPAAHAQLFVCWSFSLFRKKKKEEEIGRRMGRRKGKRQQKSAALLQL